MMLDAMADDDLFSVGLKQRLNVVNFGWEFSYYKF